MSPSGVDFSGYDLLVDTTNEDISASVSAPAKMNLDVKDAKNFSSLKQFANYVGFDNLLDFYTLYLIEDIKR